MRKAWIALLGGIALSACGGQPEGPAPGARAELRNAGGDVVGNAILFQSGNDVVVRASVNIDGSIARGFHIHETGRCEAPFESAGGHFNPTDREHGFLNPDGSHAGDITNIVTNGTTQDHTRKDLQLESLFDADGSALVVHASQDDYKTNPSGNSGARIACGVISRP